MPRALGAAVLLLAILRRRRLRPSIRCPTTPTELVDSLPVAAQKLRDGHAQRSAGDAASAARHGAEGRRRSSSRRPRRARRTAARRRACSAWWSRSRRFNVRDYLWSGTIGLISAARAARRW